MLCRVVTEFLYVEQVFGGGVQENPLFPVARQPDRLQSRLLVLCYMENHAKFQVCQYARIKLLILSSKQFFFFPFCQPDCDNLLWVITQMSLKALFLCPGAISSRMPMSSCVTCWTISTGSSSTVAMGRLTQSHLRMGSDSPPQRANVACKPI